MSCEYQIRVFFSLRILSFIGCGCLLICFIFINIGLWFLGNLFLKSKKLILSLVTAASHNYFMTLIERFFNDYCQTETVQTANQNKIRYYRNHQEFKEKQANRCNLRLFLAVHCLGRRLALILYTKNAKLMQSQFPFENRNKIALQQQFSNDSWLVCVSYHTNMFKYALRTFI